MDKPRDDGGMRAAVHPLIEGQKPVRTTGATSALQKYGAPEIFNTDQGAQFTSEAWLQTLQDAGVRISMDGKGRWIDNVFIERLWRTVKYEEVYLHAYRDGREARERLTCYFDFYNRERVHQALDYRTPDEAYCSADSLERAGGAGSSKSSEASNAFGVRLALEENSRKIGTRAETMAG